MTSVLIAGFALSTGFLLNTSSQILYLGWSSWVPFLLSLTLVAVGLHVRLGIFQTPAFAKLLAGRTMERMPMLEVIKRHPKETIFSAFACEEPQAVFRIQQPASRCLMGFRRRLLHLQIRSSGAKGQLFQTGSITDRRSANDC